MFFAAKKMGVQKMLRLHNYQVTNGIARLLLLPCIACHHNFRMGVTALYVGKLSQARGGGGINHYNCDNDDDCVRWLLNLDFCDVQ